MPADVRSKRPLRTAASKWRSLPAQDRKDLINFIADDAASMLEHDSADGGRMANVNKVAIAVLLEAAQRPKKKAARR